MNTGYYVKLSLTVALFAMALATGCGPTKIQSSPQLLTGAGEIPNETLFKTAWSKHDSLSYDQKFKSAQVEAELILATARHQNNQEQWARALIAASSAISSQGGFEKGTQFLRNEPWPEDALWHFPLELTYAERLIQYSMVYRGDISQREFIASDDELEMKQWTASQLEQEIRAAYLRLWDKRESWGQQPLGVLGRFFKEASYPARIRGTLRDVYAYSFAKAVQEGSPEKILDPNSLFHLDVPALIHGSTGQAVMISPADENLHFIEVVAAVLDDLEQWHLKNKEPEAALAARMEKLESLSRILHKKNRLLVLQNLESTLEEFDTSFAWWSSGQALLAQMYSEKNDPNSKILSHKAAQKGYERHPDSVGGHNCKVLMDGLEQPEWQMVAMKVDSANQRSIRMELKNVKKVYFRAWRLNVQDHVEKNGNFYVHSITNPLDQWIKNNKADLQWSVEIPDSGDYRKHVTYATLSADELGLYLVAGSLRKDFAESSNLIKSASILISDLLLISNQAGKNREITARSGKDGRLLEGVEVKVYRLDRRKGNQVVFSGRTDKNGHVLLPADDYKGGQHIVFAKKGKNLAYLETQISFVTERKLRKRSNGDIFTDRSVYRPGQTVQWKLVGYEVENGSQAKEMLTDKMVVVSLKDTNYKTVASDTLFTNAMGTVSGEFKIPTGRTLGQWHMESSFGGRATIRVEEYKRPTFEVLIPSQKTPARLNRPVHLTGNAQYYFGMAVTEGDFKWRVERSTILRRFSIGVSPAVVATGDGSLDSSGEFNITFIPEADEDLAEDKWANDFVYTLTVDVTDAGGELRSVVKTFRVGFVAIDARITSDWDFLLEGKKEILTVTRTNLNGEPQAGKGTWSLMAVEQPQKVLLPSEYPVIPRSGVSDPYLTPGDKLSTRWSVPGHKQDMSQWPLGARLTGGNLEHGDSGIAEVVLPDLRPGAYRLVYKTSDEEGNERQKSHDFVVAGKKRTPLALALVLEVEKNSVRVGETARLLVKSALPQQEMELEIFQDSKRIKRMYLKAGINRELIEIPITEKLRGGFSVRLSALRDHQFMQFTKTVFVPYDNKELEVEFITFRDLLKPGQKESFTVKVKGVNGTPVEKQTTELLAYMYDRSLDLIAPHRYPDLMRIYNKRSGFNFKTLNIGQSRGRHIGRGFALKSQWIYFNDQILKDSYVPFGGGAGRGVVPVMAQAGGRNRSKSATMATFGMGDEVSDTMMDIDSAEASPSPKTINLSIPSPPEKPEVEIRQNFAETAFFAPYVKLDDDGTATIEFEVPDSVTDWNVWVHAVTADLRSGSASRTASSVKELMVRTYLPRFLREGDQADLKVLVNNAGENNLNGTLSLQILDAVTGEDRASDFGLKASDISDLPFAAEAGKGFDQTISLKAPHGLSSVIVRAEVRADGVSDGEQRPLPILPSRLHLMQSRFVALNNQSVKTMHFADMAKNDDPTMTHDQLVVTVDGQLFYGVLGVLPYLVEYPYTSTEQLLNRYLSTGIVTSVFDKYPAVATMAKKLSERKTRFERFDEADPNRTMRLEETPWLNIAEGGRPLGADSHLINVLDPEMAGLVKEQSLSRLRDYQAPDGGFPWMAGGRTSTHMTLYVLSSFARGLEFGVEAPWGMVHKAWVYVHRDFEDELVEKMIKEDCCLSTVTYLNYVLSCYPDESYYDGTFSSDQRALMLKKSFENWRKLSPRLKGYLTLTLDREGRGDDARLVFESVMDGAIEDEQLGTYWTPEDRAWLWYNDTVESHATILRVLTELDPQDDRRHGMVHWLLMNKKLNHWKSTRATAEVVYALVHYLDKEQMLGVREEIVVDVGAVQKVYVFEPDEYTGKKNQLVVDGVDIDPAASSTVTVSKETKGMAFASATWHFSTDELPDEARGDLFQVERRMFKRELVGDEWTLTPLDEGAEVLVGDQVEVQLTIRAKHAAEYVHLRDPRGAGFEPESVRSGYTWSGGIGYYAEVRDSGMNFFFGWLPAGEYVLKYRVRANMGGEFRVGPAVLQSVYAPEFVGYSEGDGVGVKGN